MIKIKLIIKFNFGRKKLYNQNKINNKKFLLEGETYNTLWLIFNLFKLILIIFITPLNFLKVILSFVNVSSYCYF